MNPFNLTPDKALEEATRFNEKLVAGLKTLSDLDDIDVGTAPKDAVYKEDKLVLYRYRSQAKKRCKVPLLISYALVNRPYMTDLQPDRSLVRSLLDLGIDVYLIDWGYPDGADRYLTLDDYINRYIDNCVEQYLRRAWAEANQPAGNLPGRHILAVLQRAASGEGAQPDHHGDSG